MSLVKTFIETPRYKALKMHIDREIDCVATYQKHGTNYNHNMKTTCVSNINVGDKILTDHTWIETTLIAKKRPKQGQSLKLRVIPRKRIRPGSTIDERLLDIAFELIKVY
jgi:hypothetical protein